MTLTSTVAPDLHNALSISYTDNMSNAPAKTKTTFLATAPDGTVYTATSTKPYTHATLVRWELTDGTLEWFLAAIATRPDLAMRNTNKFLQGIGETYGEGRILRAAKTVPLTVASR